MIEVGKCVTLALLLAALTAFLGFLGLRGWDGEGGGTNALLWFGLPLLWGWGKSGSPVVGSLAQVLACLAPVAAIRGLLRLRRWKTGGDGEESVPDPWSPPDTREVAKVVGVADGDRSGEPAAHEG
jgi:hypothetical protein